MYPTKFRNCARPVNTFSFFDDNMTRDLFRNPWKMQWSNVPSVNIKESEQNFNIEVAAPGLSKEDFKIEMKENVLTISTEKKMENNETNEKYSRREFAYHNFQRTFSVPENIDVENIRASYENGLLNVILPKMEITPVNARKINVQ